VTHSVFTPAIAARRYENGIDFRKTRRYRQHSAEADDLRP